jgi:hypothetical protein
VRHASRAQPKILYGKGPKIMVAKHAEAPEEFGVL